MQDLTLVNMELSWCPLLVSWFALICEAIFSNVQCLSACVCLIGAKFLMLERPFEVI